MNVSPLPPVVVGAAGAPLAQSKGSEVERSGQESAHQQRQVQADAKADSAAGIGTTEEQSGASADRDADGRRLWEVPAAAKAKPKPEEAAEDRTSRDATGQCGTQLDLSG